MLFAVVTLIWIIVYIAKNSWVKSITRNLAISFISIVFLLHPKITEQSLNMLR